MNPETLIESFSQNKSFSTADIIEFLHDDQFRADLVAYFKKNRNRAFAVALLDRLIALRTDEDNDVTNDDLMLACHILGVHGEVRDCLQIWEAKTTDFDTYCGLDIQQMVFAGVSETISFLETTNTPTALRALEYVMECNRASDFENIDEYFNSESYWWL